MSECEQPMRRNGDRSRMAALANSAVLTLASRAALILVMGLIAFLAQRSLGILDRMDDDLREVSQNIAVMANRLDDHARRIEKVEGKVFR